MVKQTYSDPFVFVEVVVDWVEWLAGDRKREVRKMKGGEGKRRKLPRESLSWSGNGVIITGGFRDFPLAEDPEENFAHVSKRERRDLKWT